MEGQRRSEWQRARIRKYGRVGGRKEGRKEGRKGNTYNLLSNGFIFIFAVVHKVQINK